MMVKKHIYKPYQYEDIGDYPALALAPVTNPLMNTIPQVIHKPAPINSQGEVSSFVQGMYDAPNYFTEEDKVVRQRRNNRAQRKDRQDYKLKHRESVLAGDRLSYKEREKYGRVRRKHGKEEAKKFKDKRLIKRKLVSYDE